MAKRVCGNDRQACNDHYAIYKLKSVIIAPQLMKFIITIIINGHKKNSMQVDCQI